MSHFAADTSVTVVSYYCDTSGTVVSNYADTSRTVVSTGVKYGSYFD